MVKKGCTKCPECGKMVSKKGMSAHKCDTLKASDTIICMTCKTKLKAASYKAHVPSCEARTLFKKHRSFFKFFLRSIRRNNRTIEMREAKERRKQAFNKIYDLFADDKEYLKENAKDLIKVEEDNMRRKADIEALREATKVGITISKSLPVNIIKEVFRNSQPKISARQVIFKYLQDHGKYNKFIKFWVNKCFKHRDYMTDEEFTADNIIFNKLQTLRVYSGYKEIFSPFYDMLHTHFCKPEAYTCPFCDHYFLKVRDHANICKTFRNLFDENKEESILEFIKVFYPQYINEKNDVDYFIDYYKQYTASYFISSIDIHMKNRIAYRENILKGKQTILAPMKLSTKDLIKQVNDWHPDITLVKKSFESEEPQYSPLISEKEDNDEEDKKDEEKPIEEKIQETMKNFFKVKKQPLPPQEVEEEEVEEEAEEEESETEKQEKQEREAYFRDLNDYFDPDKKDYDLKDLDKI